MTEQKDAEKSAHAQEAKTEGPQNTEATTQNSPNQPEEPGGCCGSCS